MIILGPGSLLAKSSPLCAWLLMLYLAPLLMVSVSPLLHLSIYHRMYLWHALAIIDPDYVIGKEQTKT
ncbi:uncharacterized protein BO66DRAFT_389473 [Aspergillus aculeatinus CBS 121060]|uniref:Uncharacterized protein n=1 Tax=Aspergillus aculeatinus CBS 121060 TaxID=1448322 RepID=A0ACD1HH01_9EURO|nr:hypothetical protein BO66DRAFT_389473 [Aspergillus aculeatinus CBS 121060]RAH72899.1 hypothetical protein BO66DRAFT_389473 [Aspergillus aculeatinus CBS 121060]